MRIPSYRQAAGTPTAAGAGGVQAATRAWSGDVIR